MKAAAVDARGAPIVSDPYIDGRRLAGAGGEAVAIHSNSHGPLAAASTSSNSAREQLRESLTTLARLAAFISYSCAFPGCSWGIRALSVMDALFRWYQYTCSFVSLY